MTIKQQGGIFGRNPTFNDLTAGSGSSIEGSGDNVTFSVDRTDASTAGALVLRAANGNLSIDSDGADKDILIRTGGSTERARFYGDSGDFSIKGNLVVDSGNGIDFSATSGTGTSELFSDYEEGTYTVSLRDANSGGNVSATTATGYYTKIGNLVAVSFSGLNNIDTTGMTGGTSLRIDLPFAVGQASCGSIVLDGFNTTTGKTQVNLRCSASASVATIAQSGDNTTDGNLNVDAITSGSSDIAFACLTYQV